MTEQYKRHPNTICKICSKRIYRRPFQIKKNKGRIFCSMMCYGIYCRKEHPCIVCKKPILAGLNKRTCSRTCANKNRSGIKYKQGRINDKVVLHRALKLRLLKSRGDKCEKCGYSKLEILQMHHKDKNRSNNELNNLELVCPNCHFEKHYLERSWLKNRLGEVG